MLRDIVHETIERQPDMLVVSEQLMREDVSAAGAPAGIDVVIAGLGDDTLPERYTGFMCAHPRVKILGLSGDARRAFLFELRPQRIPLGAASPDGLVEAIRVTARGVGA